MSMTVDNRPASLWMHAMFAVVADLDKSGLCFVDLMHDSSADFVIEFKQWLSIDYLGSRAVAACAALRGRLDERIVGCVLRRIGRRGQHELGHFPLGGGVPARLVVEAYQPKEMYGLYHLLRHFCKRHPDVLRWASSHRRGQPAGGGGG